MAAVVSIKYHYGVVGQIESIERVEHRAHAVVHALDHRSVLCVGLFVGRCFLFVLCSQLWLGLNRRMHSVVAEVEEKRTLLVCLHELGRLDTQTVGEVFAFFSVH